MTHITDEQLVAYALDDVEAGTRAAVESHVESCAACRASLDEIRADARARPRRSRSPNAATTTARRCGTPSSRDSTSRRSQRDAALGTPALRHRHLGTSCSFVRPLARRRGDRDARRRRVLARTPRRGNRQRAAGAVNVQASLGTEAIRERVVLAALGEHFDRTERTLVELVEQPAGPPRGHLGRAGLGARSARGQPALSAGQPGATTPALSQVLEDLEPVLLEIANSPSQITSDEFEALRDRIEARSLVFKVRVTGADVRARERALIRRGESQS